MEKLQFKTNIKCGGCIATVTPFLNGNEEITNWQVDTANADKVLTVEGNVTPEEVMSTLEKAGFKGEPI